MPANWAQCNTFKKKRKGEKTLRKETVVKNLSVFSRLTPSQEPCSKKSVTSQSSALPDTLGTPAQQTTISSKYIPGTQLVFQLGA